MGRARFGTDGVRGVANAELSPELVLALGRATARKLLATTFVVGRDTRRSSPMLQAALSAGLAGEGADVIDVGVLPTPAIAWLSATRDIPGAVVSASHNPFADNGIKLFGRGGTKLSVEAEAAIEDELDQVLDAAVKGPRSPEGFGVGRLMSEPGAADDYLVHLDSLLEGRRLDGLKLVVDGANGAASEIAARLYEQVGAEVMAIGCEPDGANINAGCGSTHTDTLAGAVVEHGADLGLALDGDADRLLAVDATGATIGGDELLALFAIDLAERGQLAGNTVVVTVMTNLGFTMAMEKRGIKVKQTPVGDRNVLAALDSDGLALGGEQSGHIIFRRLATTGDGLLTGLLLADLMSRSGKPLAELLDGLVDRVPQVLLNVAVPDPGLLSTANAVWSAVAEEEARLGVEGRVLLRPSGTEPLVRVMVEATGDGVAEAIAQRLSALVRHELQAAAAPPSQPAK
ncbi:MAG TPA: phosphoglucosamine mutase [Acidimicrobiales bacterium]|jgi:phosphoglucosamine mutase|nr:phosphoglucosamine mutase [Acidimicrobiales bacterium]